MISPIETDPCKERTECTGEQRKLTNKRIDSMAHQSDLDTDKVVDCTVAAMEQSIIRDKLNANEDDITDNELDDDDDEGLYCQLLLIF